MTATIVLRCDTAPTAAPCHANTEIRAVTAVAAREEALDAGWASRRTRVGANGTATRDYCPDCAAHLNGGMRNLPPQHRPVRQKSQH